MDKTALITLLAVNSLTKANGNVAHFPDVSHQGPPEGWGRMQGTSQPTWDQHVFTTQYNPGNHGVTGFEDGGATFGAVIGPSNGNASFFNSPNLPPPRPFGANRHQYPTYHRPFPPPQGSGKDSALAIIAALVGRQ